MFRITVDYHGDIIERVSKPTARHIHSNGYTVYVCPSYMNPLSEYCPLIPVFPSDDIDKFLADYNYYNHNSSVINYPAFYASVDAVDYLVDSGILDKRLKK